MRIPRTWWARVLTLCFLLPASALAQNSADRLTDDARRLVDEGSYQQALQQLERAIEVDASYHEAYFVLGYAQGRLGDHAAAAEAFLTATRLRPGWGDAHRMAAMAASNAAQMDVAWEQVIRAQHAGIDMSREIEVRRRRARRQPTSIDTWPGRASCWFRSTCRSSKSSTTVRSRARLEPVTRVSALPAANRPAWSRAT